MKWESEKNYLAHHGIKGQKWGTRRFQNEDGSLTPEGQERYGSGQSDDKRSQYKRGKQYAMEMDRIHRDEVDKMRKSSKEYQKNEKEVKRLTEKYKLDVDDDELEDYMLPYSKQERELAKARVWNAQENMNQMDEKFKAQAKIKASEAITKKYGDTALKDIENYETKHAVRTMIAASASIAVLTLFMTNRSKRHRT